MLSPRRQAQAGLFAACVLYTIAFTVVLAGSLREPDLQTGQPGSEASLFRLPEATGRMVSLASMRGDIVVLSFSPAPETLQAEAQVSHLAQLSEKYGKRRDVHLVNVFSGSEDLNREQLRRIDELADDAGPGCTTLLDPTSHAMDRYCVSDTPTTIIIDGSGIIRYRGDGDVAAADPSSSISAGSIVAVIDLLLAERPVPGPRTPAVLSNIK